jgi:hypothetical protein
MGSSDADRGEYEPKGPTLFALRGLRVWLAGYSLGNRIQWMSCRYLTPWDPNDSGLNWGSGSFPFQPMAC